ncbi:MAG TPA: winged helix DNA-binding domain-containing protein [Mycobacteriales bacterium]|nr:winged helix DNA-binding domain-containing protein [Mycobacteriales bacterium]
MAVRRIGVEERRARLGARHHLAGTAKAADPVEVAGSLVGLHGTDPASVFLAAAARLRAPDAGIDAVWRALYDDRSLLRLLGMRRTVFVLPIELAAVVQAGCTRAIAVTERRKLVRFVAESGAAGPDPARWLAEVERDTLTALAARGEALATELSADVPALRTEVVLAAGTRNETRQRISSRVLLVLAAEGRIVRTRPRGSWVSSQYRWTPAERWLPGGLPDIPIDAARAELARRWLASYGPGTVADLRWWTGWTLGQARGAVAEAGAVEVEVAEGTGLVLPDDVEPAPATEPWVALLPGLDPTAMGWAPGAGRAWYLGEHGPVLFDRTGNVGPTVWCDGRIVGGWAQRPDGVVAYRLLEDIGAEATAAVAEQADRLGKVIGEARVTPRFGTPLHRELSG